MKTRLVLSLMDSLIVLLYLLALVIHISKRLVTLVKGWITQYRLE